MKEVALMKKTVLILGAGGFLGRYLCREGKIRGWRVVGVGRKIPTDSECDDFLAEDLLELDLQRLLRKTSPECIINAAGASSVSDSFLNPYRDFQQNVEVQAKMLEGIRQYGKKCFYIFLSSAAVYGEPETLPVREDTSCRPISPYGVHKRQAEVLQEEYVRFFGLKGAALRIFSAYGEGLERQVVYELTKKIQEAKDFLEVYGTGEETRDFIHASEVARIVYAIAEKKAEGVFNVASGKQTRIADLAQRLVNELRPGLPIVFTGEGKEGNQLKWEADITRLSEI